MNVSKPLLCTAIFSILLTACGNSESESETATAAIPAAPATSQTTEAPAPTPPAAPAAAAPAEPAPEFASLPAPYVNADFARGKRLWRQCSSCHTVAEDAGDLVGPNLHQLFGREVGSREGFSYSNALTEADFTWTPEKLDEWLTSPRNFLPGNRMSFAGVRKPKDRENVIAYLMVESGWSAE